MDFGIVGRLGPAERRYLAEILWGFLRRDYAAVSAIHFDAGYVPAHHDRAAFAQALQGRGRAGVRADGCRTSPWAACWPSCSEITALFDMRLRPGKLVLLQKTMVTVEGVARRIDPGPRHLGRRRPGGAPLDHARAFSATAARDFIRDARAAVSARAGEDGDRTDPKPEAVAVAPSNEPVSQPERAHPALWFAFGAAASALSFALAMAYFRGHLG